MEFLKDMSFQGTIRTTYEYNDIPAVNFDTGETDFRSWEERNGTFDFTMFAAGFKGDFENGTFVDAQYAFMRKTQFIQKAEFGYKFNKRNRVIIGNTAVPFGIEPYDFHNIGCNINRLLGFSLDRDTGIKYQYEYGQWAFQTAFFKTADYKRPDNRNRWTYDVATMTRYDSLAAYYFPGGTNSYNSYGSENNEESNQFNLKATYTLKHSQYSRTEFGLYGQWGQIYNSATSKNGDAWACGAHVDGNWGRWNLQLEAMTYEYNPEDPDGVDRDVILMQGVLDAFYIASKASLFTANIAYTLPVNFGPVTHINFHNDYNIMVKAENDWPDSHYNATGMLFIAGRFRLFVDLILQKNVCMAGGGIDGLAGARYDNPYMPGSSDWTTTFKMDLGFYF